MDGCAYPPGGPRAKVQVLYGSFAPPAVLVNTSTFIKIFKHRRALIAKHAYFLLNVLLFRATTLPVGDGGGGGGVERSTEHLMTSFPSGAMLCVGTIRVLYYHTAQSH